MVDAALSPPVGERRLGQSDLQDLLIIRSLIAVIRWGPLLVVDIN